jgi:DNA-binding NarL/FixJ family response regulator
MTARVAILAQDLIWADRLASAVRAAGGQPVGIRPGADLQHAFADAELAIVDLTARAYDPLTAIEAARAAGGRVVAVGQHDDHALRKRALASGAERVYAYRKLFEDGPATIAGLLARGETAAPRT